MINRFITIIFLSIACSIFPQTIEEKSRFTFDALKNNNEADFSRYEEDILKYEKKHGVDSTYLILLNFYAFNYFSFKNFEKSIKFQKEYCHLTKKEYGDLSIKYLQSLFGLTSIYSKIGKDSNSIELNLKCLNIEEKILGKEHSEYLTTLNNLALNYSNIGNFSKSLELNIICLSQREKLLGKEHPQYLTSLSNLALNYSELGDYNKSLELNIECLQLREKILGKVHPQYLISLDNLADVYLHLGDYKKSLELNLECLQLREKILGKEHPDYLNSLNTSASILFKSGDLNNSIKLTLECLELRKEILGIEHPDYIVSLNNLALIYTEIGDYTKAKETYNECLIITEKILGVNHPDYLKILDNFSVLLTYKGEYNKALEINLQVVSKMKSVLGNNHPSYLQSVNNLAAIYMYLGDHNESIELNIECLKLRENIFGKDHPDYLQTLNNLACNYLEIEDYNKSIELNLECLKLREKILGKEHPDYLNSLSNLACNYLETEDYNKSIELNLECLKLREKILGKEHPDYLQTLNNLACNYLLIGDYNKSIELNLECIKSTEIVLGNEHSDYLNSLITGSLINIRLKKYLQSDSLILLENKLLINKIRNGLIGLNTNQKENFKNYFINEFITFTNYSVLRDEIIPYLKQHNFNSWIYLNGIISNQSAQLESQIRASKDSSLIPLFEKWQLNKLQLLKYYELTKPELEKRGINITELEEEINEQERALSRGSEVFSEMKKTYTLSDIQNQLKEDEAYVDIVRLPYYNFNTNVWSDTIRYLAYIITKDTKEIPTTVLLENGNQLEEEIASYYAENTFGKSKREKDSISYTYFWKPISKELLGKKKIYLSSGGVYNNINVQTLFNPSTNKYVSEELEVQLVNNGRTFIQQKTKKPQQYSNNTATFIGYPNFNGALSKGSINEDAIFATTREFSPMLLDTLSRGANVSPLPGTKKEVETIGQLLKTKQWNVTVLTENNASEEEIKNVESPRVLHIATHGYFLKQTDNLQKESGLRMMGMDTKRFVENPLLRSGLLLSGANKTLKGDTTKASENGILTAYEAAYLHLQGTELVVLSACETGKGELKNGEGVYGLRKSFADAGAKNIIMSLWKVDDKVTQEFMTSFYTNWSTGITIREAFNKTQQSIKALYPQPYYWGAFILVGE